MSPDVSTYLSKKDYARVKLRCHMRNITLYQYVQEAILHSLEQIEKHGLNWLDDARAKKKKTKSWMDKMPIIELDT